MGSKNKDEPPKANKFDFDRNIELHEHSELRKTKETFIDPQSARNLNRCLLAASSEKDGLIPSD